MRGSPPPLRAAIRRGAEQAIIDDLDTPRCLLCSAPATTACPHCGMPLCDEHYGAHRRRWEEEEGYD